MPEQGFVDLKRQFQEASRRLWAEGLTDDPPMSSRQAHSFARSWIAGEVMRAEGVDEVFDPTGEEAAFNVLLWCLRTFGSLRPRELRT